MELRLVGIARGEQEYFDPNGIPTATEACKSNALMRCCKDLGIASELWDPRFIREFKAKYCIEVFAEDVRTKKKYVTSHVFHLVTHFLFAGRSSGAGKTSLRSSTPSRSDTSHLLPDFDLLHAVPYHPPALITTLDAQGPLLEIVCTAVKLVKKHKQISMLQEIRNINQLQAARGAFILVYIC